MIDFLNLLSKRESCRAYKREIPELSVIKKVLNLAKCAPNACNLQTYYFIYIDDSELLTYFSKKVTGKINWAPGLIIALNDLRYDGDRRAGLQSLAASINTLTLSAQYFGLGTCWMAGFKNDEIVKNKLLIPDYYEISALISIGYPSYKSSKFRYYRPIEEIFSHNSFGYHASAGNDSSNVREWDINNLICYRKRISSVYGSRHGLGAYPLAVYRRCAQLFIGWLDKKSLNSSCNKMLDLVTYDGYFVNELKTGLRLQIDYSDLDKQFLNFLDCDGEKKLISDLRENEYDIVTLVNKIEFQPNLSELVGTAYKTLKNGGVLYITSVSPWAPKAIIHLLFSRLTKGNVYIKNPYYRIGPFSHLNRYKIKKCLKKTGFKDLKSSIKFSKDFFWTYEIVAKK